MAMTPYLDIRGIVVFDMRRESRGGKGGMHIERYGFL